MDLAYCRHIAKEAGMMENWTPSEVCRERIPRDHALLRIVINDPNVLQIVKSMRVSFGEKLGIAGGTIGLFTGLSLISVIETVYWFTRLVKETLETYGRKRHHKPLPTKA